jgi:hypothetical protein
MRASPHEIGLLARKFCVLHKFYKERRRSPRGYFECSDINHFIADCLKRKKLDSSNKYDYTKQNDYSKADDKKKHWFREKDEEEVSEDDVPSMCCPQRSRLLQR